jgi:hypothetical protein
MSIVFHCPACRAPITLPDEYAGLKARCKACGHKLVVPGQQSDEADALPANEAPPPRRPAAAPPRPANSDPFADLGSSSPTAYPTGPREDPTMATVRTLLSIFGFLILLCCLGPALFFRAARLGRTARQAQERNR